MLFELNALYELENSFLVSEITVTNYERFNSHIFCAVCLPFWHITLFALYQKRVEHFSPFNWSEIQISFVFTFKIIAFLHKNINLNAFFAISKRIYCACAKIPHQIHLSSTFLSMKREEEKKLPFSLCFRRFAFYEQIFSFFT